MPVWDNGFYGIGNGIGQYFFDPWYMLEKSESEIKGKIAF